MKLPSFDHAAGAAIIGVILAGPHLIGWRGLAADTWTRTLAVLGWPRRIGRRLRRHGKHAARPMTAVETEIWLDSLHPVRFGPDAPAPDRGEMAQESRPGDPPLRSGAVRAGATDEPQCRATIGTWRCRDGAGHGGLHDFGPDDLPTPVPHAAAGQAPDAAIAPAPRAVAAPAAQVPSLPLPGPGQHPFSAVTLADLFWPQQDRSAPVPPTAGHGQRWEDITRPRPHPLQVPRRGHQRRPIAVIRNGSVSVHPTGVMPAADELSPDDQLYAAAMRHAAASQRWAGADDTDTLRRTLAGLRAL